MARIVTGGFATFNLSTHLDAQTLDLYGIADFFKTPTYTGASWKMEFDASSNFLMKASGACIGYGTGAGGSVTQTTSKSTAVTLNKATGQITMNNAALAANTAVQFVLNNSLISATDIVAWTQNESVSGLNYDIKTAVGTGYVRFTVKNVSGGSLSEAIVVNFAVIKGAAS